GGRLHHRRPQARAPVGGGHRRLLRRAQGSALLREPLRVHDPGAVHANGAGSGQRHPALARSDGRHGSDEGRPGNDPPRLRLVHRGQRRPRLRRARDRRLRDPVLLQRAGDLPALEPDVFPATLGARERWSTLAAVVLTVGVLSVAGIVWAIQRHDPRWIFLSLPFTLMVFVLGRYAPTAYRLGADGIRIDR